jgi:hypothetical protein
VFPPAPANRHLTDMTSRELRNQRRAAERKQKKLERRNTVTASPAPVPPLSALIDSDLDGLNINLDINPELLDEFTPEMMAEANRIRERVHARIGIASETRRQTVPRFGAAFGESTAKLPASPDKPGHSTGPRTPHGKLVSSRNAFKHGLASSELIVAGECREHFESLLENLLEEHQPANVTEDLLVRQMAQSFWLSQRALRLQNSCFSDDGVDTHKLALFIRYQTTHERAFHKSLTVLMHVRKERLANEGKFVSQPAKFVSQNSSPVRVSSPESIHKSCSTSQDVAEKGVGFAVKTPEAA